MVIATSPLPRPVAIIPLLFSLTRSTPSQTKSASLVNVSVSDQYAIRVAAPEPSTNDDPHTLESISSNNIVDPL